jgi:hypothetical protein
MKLFPDVWPFEGRDDGTSFGIVSSTGSTLAPLWISSLFLDPIVRDVLVLKYTHHRCFVMPIINLSSNVDVIRTVISDALESFP